SVGCGIVLCAFLDPAAEEIDLIVGQGLAAEGHLRFRGAGEISDDDALVRVARGEGCALIAALGEIGEGGERESGLAAGGLMAAGAIAGEDRANLLIETDGLGRQQWG